MNYSELILSSAHDTRETPSHPTTASVSQCGLRKEDVEQIGDFDMNIHHKKREILSRSFCRKKVKE